MNGIVLSIPHYSNQSMSEFGLNLTDIIRESIKSEKDITWNQQTDRRFDNVDKVQFHSKSKHGLALIATLHQIRISLTFCEMLRQIELLKHYFFMIKVKYSFV